MPPKAKRYRVRVLDPIMNSWRVISGPLTSADSTKLMGMIMWETTKEEVKEDGAGR